MLKKALKRLACSKKYLKGLFKKNLMDDSAVLEGFVVDCRLGKADNRINIGIESVLSCLVVLERATGCVNIGNRTYIGGGTKLIVSTSISIGNDVMISWGCTIVDHDSHSLDYRQRAEDIDTWRKGLIKGGLHLAAANKNWGYINQAPISIHDKAWIGMDVLVLKGVTIGEGAVVAARSVVTKDVPPWTLVAGNPAREIRSLPKDS
jgi:acetyltransferase-like isoleucine patch superfamily enzyme